MYTYMYDNTNTAPLFQMLEQMYPNMEQHMEKMFKDGNFPFDKQACRKMFKNCPRRGRSRGENKDQKERENEKTYQITIPLKRFDPKNVKISLNEKALMTISASSEFENETGRNGMRRITTIVEETVQLPDYLLSDMSAIDKVFPDIEKEMSDEQQQASTSKNADATPKKLISQVKTHFENGFLIITVPNKPEEKKEEKAEDKKDEKKNIGPVDIEIEFV